MSNTGDGADRKPVGTSISRYRRMLYEVQQPRDDGRCRHGFAVAQCAFCQRRPGDGEAAEPPGDGIPDALMRWILRNRTTTPRDKRNVRREPNRAARLRFAESGQRRIERLLAVAIEWITDGRAVCKCEPWRRSVCAWCALLGSVTDATASAEWRKREVRNPVSGRLPLDD